MKALKWVLIGVALIAGVALTYHFFGAAIAATLGGGGLFGALFSSAAKRPTIPQRILDRRDELDQTAVDDTTAAIERTEEDVRIHSPDLTSAVADYIKSVSRHRGSDESVAAGDDTSPEGKPRGN